MIQHLACIMDGNRRWAKRQGLMPWLGHNQGAESVKRVIQFALDNNIKYVSLYTFSIENFKRSEQELSHLFSLLIRVLTENLAQFIEQGVNIRFIGDEILFPESIRRTIGEVEEKTSHCSKLYLNLLFCYGGQQEIIGAVKKVLAHLKNGLLALEDFTEDLFRKYLWMGNIPEPELIIRTGGTKRLSNFLLYQAAYSELYFLDCLWPDITEQDLTGALNEFKRIQRKLGA